MHWGGLAISAHALAAKLPQRAGEFWRARQAIAAAEFALVLPILLILMLGSVEAARLIISAQRVTQVATTIVEMLSQNGTGTVNYVDLDFAVESTMVIFPQILQDAAQKGISWNNDISISMASVCFWPNSSTCTSTCTSNCSYIANVVWNSGPPTTSERAGFPLLRSPIRRCRARRRFPPMSLGPVRSSSSMSSSPTRRFSGLASSERFLSPVPPISRPAMCRSSNIIP
jgi:Flp pilus assembly protein TadG